MKSLAPCRIFVGSCALAASMVMTPAAAHAQQPMLGEVRFVGFSFPPRGWAGCDGQVMSIAQNPELFAVLGNTFGGDGVNTFALPDLRGRSPLGDGQGFGLSPRVLGQTGGAEAHALTLDEIPLHSHVVNDHTHAIAPLTVNLQASSAPATATTAAGNVLATATAVGGGNKVTNIYNAGPPDVAMAAAGATVTASTAFAGGTTTSVGNGTGYPILPPYLTLNCIIAIQGVAPTP